MASKMCLVSPLCLSSANILHYVLGGYSYGCILKALTKMRWLTLSQNIFYCLFFHIAVLTAHTLFSNGSRPKGTLSDDKPVCTQLNSFGIYVRVDNSTSPSKRHQNAPGSTSKMAAGCRMSDHKDSAPALHPWSRSTSRADLEHSQS